MFCRFTAIGKPHWDLLMKKEQKQEQMNKGGKFIKKLWCCVGGWVLQVI